MMQQAYAIKGMNCQSCVRKIEEGMSGTAEVVKVSLSEGQIYLTAPRFSYEDLQSRIAEIGDYHTSDPMKFSTTANHG